MEEEKRRAQRFLYAEPVAYGRFNVTVSGGALAGNISLTGISLRIHHVVPMGSILDLQLRLGDAPSVIAVKAQVVRMRQVLSDDCFEIGLKFLEDEECSKAVGAYINACKVNQTMNKGV